MKSDFAGVCRTSRTLDRCSADPHWIRTQWSWSRGRTERGAKGKRPYDRQKESCWKGTRWGKRLREGSEACPKREDCHFLYKSRRTSQLRLTQSKRQGGWMRSLNTKCKKGWPISSQPKASFHGLSYCLLMFHQALPQPKAGLKLHWINFNLLAPIPRV